MDDGCVFEVGVCSAGTSSFIRQLQYVILVREFPAHLTAAHCTAGILNAHGYNTTCRQISDISEWPQFNQSAKLHIRKSLNTDELFLVVVVKFISLTNTFAFSCCLLVNVSNITVTFGGKTNHDEKMIRFRFSRESRTFYAIFSWTLKKKNIGHIHPSTTVHYILMQIKISKSSQNSNYKWTHWPRGPLGAFRFTVQCLLQRCQ